MSITLSNSSLLSLYEFTETFYGAQHSKVASYSGSFAGALNQASKWFESQTRRTFIPTTTTIEVFSGGGWNDKYDLTHTQYGTKQAPILATPTLQYYDGTTWATSTLTIAYTTGEFLEGGGVIYLPGAQEFPNLVQVAGSVSDAGPYFTAGKDNFRVTYSYGYTSRATIPEDIKYVVGWKALQIFERWTTVGKANVSIGNQTYGFERSTPDEINDIVKMYRS